jgi:hypothetical protein
VRYLLIATVIVVLFIAVITQLSHAPGPGAKVLYASGTPSAGPGEAREVPSTPRPVTGEAPWALSALPECFRQDSRRAGLPAFAHARFPAGARLLAPGTRLRVADCTLAVGRGTVAVTRGDDHLVVPPEARLYAFPGHLVLDRFAHGREEVRVYEDAMRYTGR